MQARLSLPGGKHETMLRPAAIRAVAFDVGGTLIQPWPSVGHVYAEVASQFSAQAQDPARLNRRFAAAWRARTEQFDYSITAWAGLVAETFAGSPLAADGRFFAALYERFAQEEAWRVFDDVRPTLEWLRRRGCRLAVVSNWDERLRPLLARLRLDGWFDVIVVSAELGVRKPEPQIFTAAAARLGLPAASILHVGDSAREDLAGARDAGLQAVLLDRTRAGADAALSSLTALKAIPGLAAGGEDSR